MKAIITKYHGPGNVKGSRFSASDQDGNKVFIPYDHSLKLDDNHIAAAEALKRKMGWEGKTVMGSLGDAEVHVFID